MPYAYVEPDVFLEYKGVTVYHTYRSGTTESWEYWFTTDKDSADECGGHGHFDARIFTGLWSETPNVHQWDEWWKARFKTEGGAVDALIRTAIEDGKIR